MNQEIRFFRCRHCGNLEGAIYNSGVDMSCCSEAMEEMVANTTEAAKEKHLPLATLDGNKVHIAVGSVAHPMEEKHFIQWIYIQTKHGGQRKVLDPGDAPEADFLLENDEVIAAYAYCNIHGLWKTKL
jgi:superoxide reductase